MKLLSVVVPVYNVEKFLKRCVDSIIAQSYRNLEIILVDDGATDSSGAICDEFQTKDARIKVIHQKNGGLSAARNAGLRAAVGEYLAFVDADDYIAEDMYSAMIEALEKYDLDIIICSSYRDKNGEITGDQGNGSIKIMHHDEVLLRAMDDYEASAWNKVYKKALWNNLEFPVGRLFEDTAVSYLYFDKAQKIGFLNRAFYYYVKNTNSITQTSFKPKGRYDYYKGYAERLAFAERKGLACRDVCVSRMLKAALSCLTALYVSERTAETGKIYRELKQAILLYRDEPGATCRLNGKYKLYLYTFNRMDFIHKFGAILSLKAKQWMK